MIATGKEIYSPYLEKEPDGFRDESTNHSARMSFTFPMLWYEKKLPAAIQAVSTRLDAFSDADRSRISELGRRHFRQPDFLLIWSLYWWRLLHEVAVDRW